MRASRSRRPRGISPLLASVLLIGVTVAIATLVAGWVATVTRSTQTTAENKTSEAAQCSSGAVVIDEVYVTTGNTTTGSTRAVVRNAGGTDDIAIVSASAYNISGGNFSASGMPLADFDRGELFTLVFSNASMATCPGAFSEVLVSTSCGGVAASFRSTPKCS